MAVSEREFGLQELFFSRTDRKGIIRSGNEVFVRVSGHSLENMLGKPHNIIRHPDMPRAAFKALWDTISAGAPFGAYVKNQAADGSPYWVFAAVFPVGDDFLSIRLKPSGPHFEAAQELYRELRAVEVEIEGETGSARKQAMDVSLPLLLERLGELGFPSYRAFMHAALVAEIGSREQRLGARTRAVEPTADGPLAEILGAYSSTERFLDGLFADVHTYATLNETLGRKSDFVLELADDVRLFALNALLASTHLGERGVSLSAVASLMGRHSGSTGTVTRQLSAEIADAVGQLDELGFAIALGKLQAEMAVHFARELVTAGGDASTQPRVVADLTSLAACIDEGVVALADRLASVTQLLLGVRGDAAALRRELGVLRALQLNGRVEAARAGGASGVESLFARIAQQIEAAESELGEFSTVADVATRAQLATRTIMGDVRRVHGLADDLARAA